MRWLLTRANTSAEAAAAPAGKAHERARGTAADSAVAALGSSAEALRIPDTVPRP
ncbi:hypothetical protein Amsp01_026700 [Amycolatopsis sp. NBRC 101858]|nr:hypothetical protein Amsp01_026700 [Amycolatopsis sp. NBRC 101858]